MSFLELGFFLAGAAVGLILSFLGIAFEPAWSVVFVLQIFVCVTVFPLLFCCGVGWVLSSLPDERRLIWLRRLTFRGLQ